MSNNNHLTKKSTISNFAIDNKPLPNTALPVVTPVNPLANLQEQHIEEVAEALVEFQMTAMSDKKKHEQETKQLQKKMGRFTAIWMILILMVATAGAWTGYFFYTQLKELTTQINSVKEAQGELELAKQVQQLESQLSQLKKQVPSNLATDVEANQKKLSALEKQVQGVQESVKHRQQALVVLANAFQDLATFDQSNPLVNVTSGANSPKGGAGSQ
ncbi:hypothetical protein BJP36_03995 [Moorena producens JHB]|uniref:Uncharacterized protein n=1 Tax=Moorena producens (strain JHB) TaxID=1454205 RepID=A0A1D9FUY8_MOOP1|nr:hypothetical protein [Moorena producens]AOY79199.1 hypothetical protein BJP36_03995 [Moorena producens JHB]